MNRDDGTRDDEYRSWLRSWFSRRRRICQVKLEVARRAVPSPYKTRRKMMRDISYVQSSTISCIIQRLPRSHRWQFKEWVDKCSCFVWLRNAVRFLRNTRFLHKDYFIKIVMVVYYIFEFAIVKWINLAPRILRTDIFEWFSVILHPSIFLRLLHYQWLNFFSLDS